MFLRAYQGTLRVDPDTASALALADTQSREGPIQEGNSEHSTQEHKRTQVGTKSNLAWRGEGALGEVVGHALQKQKKAS